MGYNLTRPTVWKLNLTFKLITIGTRDRVKVLVLLSKHSLIFDVINILIYQN